MDTQLTAVQNTFEAVFYGTKTPMVIFMGPRLVIEKLNETYQSIYPGRNLLGRPLLEAVPELAQSVFPAMLKKVYDSGESFSSQEGVVYLTDKKSGKIEERYFDTTFSRIDYGNGQEYRILATPKEVTEKVRARKKIEQSILALEAEKELREKFVSALSHDLRTPLAIAKLSAQILKSKGTDPETFDHNINRILNNIDRADRMIHDLLDANRLKANEELPIFIEPCQIQEILADAIEALEDLHGKRFVVENSVTEINLFWDKTAVHRIIENLASNAIKYGCKDTPVTIRVKQNRDNLEIGIHNLGNPISKTDQKLLFHPYQRTEFAKATKQKGWGVGLSLVQGLARAHGGEVIFESDINQGTTFTVRLPIDARKK